MKKILIIVIIALCLTAGGIGVYMIATQSEEENVAIDITASAAGGASVDYSGTLPDKLMPGVAVGQVVTVSNTGSGSVWIRARVEVAFLDAQGSPLAEPSGQALLECTPGADWIDGGDGYFYYRTALAPGEVTAQVFDRLEFSRQMGNAYGNCTCRMTFVAQAVQSGDNPAVDGDVTAVTGWPET